MMSGWLALMLVVAAPDGGVEAPVWSPYLDAFGEWAARMPSDSAASNAFSVPRVHAGVEATWRGASGRVLVESVYATSGGALIGVAGDSVVLRLREAWGGYRWRLLEAQLGLVPTLTVPEVERAFLHRALSADGLELFRLKAPADFGATLRAHLPRDFGWVGASLTNGEGYTSRELNPQKNVEVTAAIHPIPAGALHPLTVLAVAMVGTSGPSAARANRFGGGVLWQAEKLGAGVTAYASQGWLDDGTRNGVLVQAFARATLWDHLLLAARLHWFHRDVSALDSQLDVIGAVGVRAAFIECFLAVQHTSLAGAARGALPGVEGTDVRVVLRARVPGVFE